jgi:hypothetical protein
MTCAEARHIILIADPIALRDRTDPALRRHLEECRECSAAASHVVGDVRRLRAALIARGSRAVVQPRRSKVGRVAMTLVPIALAAELAAFAFLGTRDNPNPLANRLPVIDDTVTSMLPGAPNGTDTVGGTVAPIAGPEAATPAKADSAHEADSTAFSRKAQRYAPADAIAPPRATEAALRQQVAAIGRSNPRIGLVWLSRVDSL